MAKRQSKSQPTRADVKAKLADFDRAALLDLIHHLYAAHEDNQTFLHARFGLGEDVLERYKKTIDRWLWPDVFGNQRTSVSEAKRAVSGYKKAVGDPEGLTELMVFYCEQAAGFCSDIGHEDEGYFDALVRMFEQALKCANTLPANGRDGLIARLDRVPEISHKFGYGVGDDMDFLLIEVHEPFGLMVREFTHHPGRENLPQLRRLAESTHCIACASVPRSGSWTSMCTCSGNTTYP